MASPIFRKLQLCPHCDQFLTRRTVLRHHQLYGKPCRPGWRPPLDIPSICEYQHMKTIYYLPNKEMVTPCHIPDCILSKHLQVFNSAAQFFNFFFQVRCGMYLDQLKRNNLGPSSGGDSTPSP